MAPRAADELTPAAHGPAATAPRAGRLGLTITLLRCDQWVKNVFVFAGVLFNHGLEDPAMIAAGVLCFVFFSMVASAVYIHNDIADRETDLRHPRKRRRPIAAGLISIGRARTIQVVLLAAGLGGAAICQPATLPFLAGYVLLNFAYSHVLKTFVLVDVMAIALGFVLRVQAGCAAVAMAPSAWLLLCTFVLAVFLGFGKRRHEVLELAGDRGYDDLRAVYGTGFLDQAMGIASAVTIVCYATFTVSLRTVAVHGTDRLVYTVPFVIYALLRYQWRIYDVGGGGDPGELVWQDRPLLAAIVLWACTCVLILYA